ncbi:uncharacterized protein HMPREF1541_02002 [Cyphellophora europaea CBS 101466]|uniref:Aminoacyl-transfer RNA synthetases class-II family profile domain-containing protein n=1 Tax=Cyphellophora europaea (strain CBS 101466) TaxID=1220924 RepID=W2S4F6_CYPE1|nr:uncharacterized protein HMPREF1541_02002 [Cyphellophora europaea CBS 101466]ETN42844.1 hypothetical protein HMPREF1541_02002 [Cyphellophora europaea CBS 101466]
MRLRISQTAQRTSLSKRSSGLTRRRGTQTSVLHQRKYAKEKHSIQPGSYIDFVGRWQPSPSKGQSHELQVENVLYQGNSNAEENPIQPKDTSYDFLRTIPHLRMRTSWQNLILRTRSHLTRAVSDYFEDVCSDPAVQVHPPLITSSDCEGAGEVFTVVPQNGSIPPLKRTGAPGVRPEIQHFFGEPKYLTVSSQLHLEAFSAELGNVWALSPTFRAEQSDTVRHLAEFYMLEAEFRGTIALSAVIDHAEALIRYLAERLANSRIGSEHMNSYAGAHTSRQNPESRWARLIAGPWPRITYRDAIIELCDAQAKGHDFAIRPGWDAGLALEHERFLVANVFDNQPVIVTNYPEEQKPFYMSRGMDMLPGDVVDVAKGSTERVETAACFDILLPDGYAEVCGGSLREHNLEKLLQKMRLRGMLDQTNHSGEAGQYPGLLEGESLGPMKWYADLRRFGSSPHGGFGIGWDRLLAYLCCVANVRDVVAFPRAWGRADC